MSDQGAAGAGIKRWERTSTRPGLVRPVRCDPTGATGPTPMQSRGPGWRRTSQGFHVPAHVDAALPEQRILEASVVAPDGYGLTGWAALRWWTGSRWFGGLAVDRTPEPVTVVTSTHGGRSQPGIHVSQEGVWRPDVTEHDGVPLTLPCCALSFQVRRLTTWLVDAVAWVDMACFTDAVSLAEVAAYAGRQRGWTGIPMLRDAVALAAENSWSPQESRTRLRWVLEAQLPPPLCNQPVFDLAGRHVATPDLLDPVAGVVAEYDGSDHLDGPRRLRDVRREEELRGLGLEYVTTLAGDSRGSGAFVERLLRAHRRARGRRERGEAPGWSVEPPPWWVPTHTVELRRALTADQRRRLLRYRTP